MKPRILNGGTVLSAWLVAVLTAPGLPAAEPEADWEVALAGTQQARFEADAIGMWVHLHGPDEQAVRRRWDAFIRRHPHSVEAARAAAERCRAALADHRWDDLLVEVPAVVRAHASFPSRTAVAVSFLGRVAGDPRAPPEVRLRAVRTLVPLARHQAFAVRACGAVLAKAELPPRERYDLAVALEEACGASPPMRQFRWQAVAEFAKTAAATDTRDACDRFLARYGDGHAEGNAASRLLLKLDGSREATATLARLGREDVERRVRLAADAAAITAALRRGDAAEVRTACATLAATSPGWAAEPSWATLVQAAEFAAAAPAVRAVFLEALFAATAPGAAQQAAITVVPRLAPEDPPTLALVARHLATNACDALQVSHQAAALARRAPRMVDAAAEAAVRAAVIEAADRVELADLAVDLRFEHACRTWDGDREAALAALRTAAGRWPEVPAAAQAGWMLSFLEGRNGLIQPLSPRPHRPQPGADAAAPTPRLPSVAARPVEFLVRDGTVTPAALDPEADLLAGRPAFAAVAGGSTEPATAAVTDGNCDTRWTPARLPATIAIPLDRIASIDRLRVRLGSPAYFTVTLRDPAGQPLARFERDWGFWEQLRGPDLWPSLDEVLRFPPVGEVAAVEVQVHAAVDEPAIAEVEAFASPVPATARHELPPQDLPTGTRGVAVAVDADEPEAEATITADRESTRGYPIMRWLRPWTRSAGPVGLRSIGSGLGIEFHGTSATVTVAGSGGVRWQLDGGPWQELPPATAPQRRSFETGALAAGRHMLLIRETPVPAADDGGGTSNVTFVSLVARGRAVVRPVVRFVAADGTAGTWLAADATGTVPVPAALASAGGPVRVQAAAVFDSRDAAGRRAATLRQLRIEPTAAVPAAAPSGVDPPEREDLATAAAAVAARDGVVTFAKTGSSAEHAAARRLAERAGLPLVPDDIGLNRYSWPVIAVGTPLRHRSCRQLLATHGLWNDPAYLRADAGLVVVDRDDRGRLETIHVTGETPAAVAAAAERLAAALPVRSPPSRPFKVFGASTLEVVYPWQLHPARPAPDRLRLRMAAGDRRSLQFGVAAEEPVAAVVECTDLASSSGQRLPPAIVRPVGGYEFVPFFGDLRLPNWLVPDPRLDLPALTAQGVWLTVTAPRDAAPGAYTGTVSVRGPAGTVEIPIVVTVDPFRLPEAPHAATMSFAAVPYWFRQGSPVWERAVRSLAANEAEHGANVVMPVMAFTARPGRFTRPTEFAVAAAGTAADELTWRPLEDTATSVAAGESLFLRFAEPIACRELAAVVRPAQTSGFEAAVPAGGWRQVSRPTRVLQATWGVRSGASERVEAAAEVLRFRMDSAASPAREWRITAAGNAFEFHGAIALGPADDRHPFAVDFSPLDEQMQFFEEAYAERAATPPTFLVQADAHALADVSIAVFGDHHQAPGDLHAWFAEQLAERLRAAGRAGRFIIKVGDEPWDFVRWAQSARPFKDGGLRVMTAHNTRYADMNVGAGIMDPWCPNYVHDVRMPFLRGRQAAGEKVWWYECGDPNTRLTGLPADNLPLYWLTAKWRLDGAVNYAALHANRHSSMPVPFRYEHGMDHRIAHDRDGSLLDTPRRELEAEGIRDLVLLEFVESRIAGLDKTDRTRAAAARAARDAIVAAVVPYRFGYPTDPAAWEAARDGLYDLAVSLGDTP